MTNDFYTLKTYHLAKLFRYNLDKVRRVLRSSSLRENWEGCKDYSGFQYHGVWKIPKDILLKHVLVHSDAPYLYFQSDHIVYDRHYKEYEENPSYKRFLEQYVEDILKGNNTYRTEKMNLIAMSMMK